MGFLVENVMKTAKFIKDICITDPDTKGKVWLSVYKHENGGIFGVDSTFLDQCFDDDEEPVVPDMFEKCDEDKGVIFEISPLNMFQSFNDDDITMVPDMFEKFKKESGVVLQD